MAGLMAVLVSIFGVIFLFVGYVILLVTVRGLVIVQLWSWFVTPVFAIRELQVLEALGLTVIAGVFSGFRRVAKKEDGGMDYGSLARAVIYPLFGLCLGWVYHTLMVNGTFGS